MVAFQEVTESSFRSVNRINISRNSKSRKIAMNNQEKTTVIIDPKKDPPHFTHTPYPAYNDKHFNSLYFVWCFLRKMNSKDQAVSSFSGWMLQLYTKCKEQSDIQKTIETYLPPINSKVTDFNTITQYMSYLLELAYSVIMPYVNITLDVGAAINAHKLLWNKYNQFSIIIIHLGGFHFMKENFKCIGGILSLSGFEDVIFQAGLCSSGTINGILCGSHYNRAWSIDNIISEALERLLLIRFRSEVKPSIPDSLQEISADIELFDEAYILQ